MAAIVRSTHGRDNTSIRLNERFGAVEGAAAWFVATIHPTKQSISENGIRVFLSDYYPSTLASDRNTFSATIYTYFKFVSVRRWLCEIVAVHDQLSTTSAR